MKRSATPTNTIIVKAFTGSEWDTVSFAIISLSNLDRKQFNDRAFDAQQAYSKDHNFTKICYSFLTDGFFLGDDEVDAILGEEFEWRFVKLTKGELEKLTKPEQDIDCETASFYSNGSVQFKGYGKHTSEEFWTSDIQVDELIKQ